MSDFKRQLDVFENHGSRIKDLEFVLFKTDGNDRSLLFQGIYDSIEKESKLQQAKIEKISGEVKLVKMQADLVQLDYSANFKELL